MEHVVFSSFAPADAVLEETMGVTEDDPQAGLKNDLKQLFTKLCGKLDALCNFHYTPKVIITEMKVRYTWYL